jgi:hypothetical protein
MTKNNPKQRKINYNREKEIIGKRNKGTNREKENKRINQNLTAFAY